MNLGWISSRRGHRFRSNCAWGTGPKSSRRRGGRGLQPPLGLRSWRGGDTDLNLIVLETGPKSFRRWLLGGRENEGGGEKRGDLPGGGFSTVAGRKRTSISVRLDDIMAETPIKGQFSRRWFLDGWGNGGGRKRV
ncbi:unnamed protein product [Linum trigynum]|uniref:Uncharacterized protein n=1 Tax=Linum trigynum TaxID=586398 RepID=A0AAV2E585_9ROSI